MLQSEMRSQTDSNAKLTRRTKKLTASAQNGALGMIATVMRRKLHGHAGVTQSSPHPDPESKP